MQDQSRGGIGNPIASMVPAGHVRQCADFRAALTAEVERLAALKSTEFQDTLLDQRLNQLREKNIDRHFTGTWINRDDDYDQVVRQGNYYFTDDGVERKCKSYAELAGHVGSGSKHSLPQVVLHVAGERIKNFLCNTYLYDSGKPLFTDARGRRVDPVPNLRTTFNLSRNAEGRITVRFSCVDPAVGLAMLLEPGDDRPGIEATPLFRASLEFHGEMHFYPNEEFEAGDIRLVGQNLHMFE
jgi:hypothetical protein